MRENQPKTREFLKNIVPDENILPTLPEKDKTQIIRYNEVLSYAKDLARHASKTEVGTKNAITKLKEIITTITKPDIIDDDDLAFEYEPKAKKKGRPRKSQIKSSFMRSIKKSAKFVKSSALIMII